MSQRVSLVKQKICFYKMLETIITKQGLPSGKGISTIAAKSFLLCNYLRQHWQLQ
jgi:hypothetical protein